MSRSADILLYRLVNSSSSSVPSHITSELKFDQVPDRDVYDYQPTPSVGNRKRKQVPAPGDSQPKNKRKVDLTAQVNAPSSLWHGQSETGRLALYSEQHAICNSSQRWYDDVIINSYAVMCQHAQRDTFTYQDTLLGTPYFRGFSSVDQKFIQIVNMNNNHWLCVSNSLTYVNEPHIVEVFDSLVHERYFKPGGQLHTMLSKYILQLSPHTTCVRYVLTQRQNNGNDCGPLALGFLWSLSNGHHPLKYEHLRAAGIRGTVRESFNRNVFVPPCRSLPRNHQKKVVKTYTLDKDTGFFNATG